VSAHAPADLQKYGWLSLGVSVVVFGIKIVAFALTGSVGLLSDALESTVNIVAALVAIVALRTASKPGDAEHHYGHGKAEYFSALVEGVMIFVAALLIIYTAVERLINPRELEQLGIGLAISAVASAINGATAVLLIRAGRRHRSIVLEADGKHLMTDVWTSAGVIVGVALVAVTGWQVLDPLIAIVVALNIVFAGAMLIRNSTAGLMDSALPESDHDVILNILQRTANDEISFHAVQTRASGRQRFVSMHVLVPGEWSVQRGHDVVCDLEDELRAALDNLTVQTHVEPREDPRSWEDVPPGGLDTEL
jgi:cation diffusion facilitator family transporter